MKVRELIARLNELDPDLPVVMPAEDRDWCEVEAAFADLVWFKDGRAQLSDERTPDGNVAVVRLFGAEEA